jgi:hypothetical protein
LAAGEAALHLVDPERPTAGVGEASEVVFVYEVDEVFVRQCAVHAVEFGGGGEFVGDLAEIAAATNPVDPEEQALAVGGAVEVRLVEPVDRSDGAAEFGADEELLDGVGAGPRPTVQSVLPESEATGVAGAAEEVEVLLAGMSW